jgi:membrane protease YdiL (CAAX protease family)
VQIQSATSERFDESLPLSARGWRALVELAIGYGLILMVLWTSRPLQRYLYLAATAWVLLVTCLSFDGWREMGLRVVGFWRSMWTVGIAAVLAAITILASYRDDTLHAPHGGVGRFVATFWGYSLWAFFQQFLMQDFMLSRLMRVMSAKAAVVVTAALFAVAHLPSPILTPLTLVWGLLACLLFLKYRNLYTLAIVHAILGVTLAISIPGPVIHNMRVGYGYLTYRPYRHARMPSLTQPE